VVKRENYADTTNEGPQQVMGAGEIERLETATNDRLLKRIQRSVPFLRPAPYSQRFIDNYLRASPFRQISK
jgi:hypothetical protein